MTIRIVNRLLLVVVVMLLCVPCSARAASGQTNITEVTAAPNVTTVGFTAFTGTCGYGVFMVGGVNPTTNQRAMYATLLAAALAGKQVYVVTGGCDGSYEILQYVSLYRP
jgi:hypothetical protein